MVPLAAWFKSELRDLSEMTLMNDRHGYFKRECLKKILDEHRGGRADHSQKIWLIMMFNAWHDASGKQA